jgi:hypothetical protein
MRPLAIALDLPDDRVLSNKGEHRSRLDDTADHRCTKQCGQDIFLLRETHYRAYAIAMT